MSTQEKIETAIITLLTPIISMGIYMGGGVFFTQGLAQGSQQQEKVWDLAGQGDDREASRLEFGGPFGSLAQSFHLFLTPIEGLQTTLWRFDVELEENLKFGDYSAKLLPWVWLKIPETQGGRPVPAENHSHTHRDRPRRSVATSGGAARRRRAARSRRDRDPHLLRRVSDG